MLASGLVPRLDLLRRDEPRRGKGGEGDAQRQQEIPREKYEQRKQGVKPVLAQDEPSERPVVVAHHGFRPGEVQDVAADREEDSRRRHHCRACRPKPSEPKELYGAEREEAGGERCDPASARKSFDAPGEQGDKQIRHDARRRADAGCGPQRLQRRGRTVRQSRHVDDDGVPDAQEGIGDAQRGKQARPGQHVAEAKSSGRGALGFCRAFGFIVRKAQHIALSLLLGDALLGTNHSRVVDAGRAAPADYGR